MTENATAQPPIYLTIRAHVRSGANLWSFIGFFLFTASFTVFISITALSALDWLKPVSQLGPSFYQMASQTPDHIGDWLAGAAAPFESLRTDFVRSPQAWFVYVLLFVILTSGVYFFSFRKLDGASLSKNLRTSSGAKALLDHFGYYKDIVLTGEREFFGHNRLFYSPAIYRRAVIDSEDRKKISKAVIFFMAHEYAHTPFFDNLLHSIIRIAFNLLTAVQGGYLALLCFTAAAMIMPGASSLPPLYFMSVFLACVVMIAFVALAIRGFRISYIKAREFYADEAARLTTVGGAQYYNAKDSDLRPSIWSALTTRLSGYERALHENGESFHARNILVFFWPVWLAVRSLYLLTAPQGWLLFVLVFDGLVLLSVAILFRSLPRYAATRAERPLTPWLVASGACCSLFLAYNGTTGLLFSERPDLFSNAFRLLFATPVLLVSLAVVAWTGWLVIRSLARGWALRERASSQMIRAVPLFLLASPGTVAEGIIFLLNVSFFTSAAVAVLQVAAVDDVLNMAFVTSFLLLAYVSCYIALQYLSMILPWRSMFVGVVAVSLIVTFVAGSLIGGMIFVMSETVTASSAPAPLTTELALPALGEVLKEADLSTLSYGTIGCIVYLALRILAFWARGQIDCMRRHEGEDALGR